jgi:membrane protein implicated in regulation of membrane protease activity
VNEQNVNATIIGSGLATTVINVLSFVLPWAVSSLIVASVTLATAIGMIIRRGIQRRRAR